MDLTAIFIVLICVGLPVTLGIGTGVFSRWAKLKEKQMELAAHEAAGRAATQAAHIERLEQRMRVLERIATDKGSTLAAQIEDLRDGASEKEIN